MNIVGKIVEIDMDATITKQAGGSYKGIRITFRDGEGSLKEQVMHMNALKYNSKMKATLTELKNGDMFTMVKVKEGEFWNVKDIIKGEVESNSGSQQSTGKGAQSNTGSTTTTGRSSTYETADERAIRQRLIVRQSSLTNSIAYHSHLKGVDDTFATINEVIDTAKMFEDYVYGQPVDTGTIEDLPSDIL